MSNYRRSKTPGACYFFTVVTKQRKPWFNSEQNIQILRNALQQTMREKPFAIDAMIVLPDHLHCIWRLPEGDSNYSDRWRNIKKRVSRFLDADADADADERGERPVWQRRFWEHQIRDENDWQNHLDYIHYNPVKHGLVKRVGDWPWSSFHRAVKKGWYQEDWGSTISDQVLHMELE